MLGDFTCRVVLCALAAPLTTASVPGTEPLVVCKPPGKWNTQAHLTLQSTAHLANLANFSLLDQELAGLYMACVRLLQSSGAEKER